jgi:antitoxin component of MazEF toxin-antitoxin module
MIVKEFKVARLSSMQDQEIVLRIPKSVCELAEWNDEDDLAFRLEGRSIIIEPQSYQDQKLSSILKGASPKICQAEGWGD